MPPYPPVKLLLDRLCPACGQFYSDHLAVRFSAELVDSHPAEPETSIRIEARCPPRR
jgi:hypothetical protein